MTKLKNLSGRRFGRWTVLRQVESRKGKARWLSRCDCGKEAEVGGGNLLYGISTQCAACSGRALIDLTGQKFGRWTVLSEEQNRITHRSEGRWTTMWKCQCECGEISLVSSGNLRRKGSTQCNKCARGFEDLSGQRFGKWTVVGRSDKKVIPQIPLWICRCDCGSEGLVRSVSLTAGKSKQCGKCSRRENPALRIRPFEALFNWVKRRALQEGHEVGIGYEDFAQLAQTDKCHYCLADVYFAKYCVNKTGHKYNLDRKDNNLGYVPGNLVPCCKRCNHAKGARFTYEEWYGMTTHLRDQANKQTAQAASA